MARTVRAATIDTRTARRRLTARRKPYWKAIEQGRHLGYYKGARGGSWVARFYLEEQRRYTETVIGTADDVSDADGHTILDYRQAQHKARAWFDEQARRAAGLEPVASGP